MRVPTALYLLLLAGVLSWNALVYREIFAPPVLRVTVLDVGKGSSVLVNSPEGKTILVDTGPDAGILRALGTTLPMWERSIDAVILTSVVPNLSGGLPDVLSRYRVATFVRSQSTGSPSRETAIADATKEVPITFVSRGNRFSTGDGVFIDVLWPPKSAPPTQTTSGAIALRISFGTTSFLIQNVPQRIHKWLSATDATLAQPNLIISSTTPKGVYISDGTDVSYVPK